MNQKDTNIQKKINKEWNELTKEIHTEQNHYEEIIDLLKEISKRLETLINQNSKQL